MTHRITTLNNGLRIVTGAMPQLRTASVGIWVGAGARDEEVSVNGVAHLLEHMAFKGTARRNARTIAEEIEAVGGHLNAYTSREQTAYYARALAEDVPLALDILADILQHSTFQPDELERERAVVIQEIGQTNDTPDDIVFDRLQEIAYPDQPMGRSILGTVERVGAMRRDDLSGFMAGHYRAPGMVLAAAGAVEHERMVELASRLLGNLPLNPSTPSLSARYQGGEYREERDLDQAHLALGFPGFAFSDPDFYALQVYATLLGGGMSSRLFQEIREKRGLAYSVYSFAASYQDTGLFTVYAGTSGEQIDELLPVVGDEMRKTAEAIGEDELARARAQLKVGLLMSLESSSARVDQLGRQMLIYGRVLDTEEVIAAVDAVDVDAVLRVAKRLLDGGEPCVAAIGPLGQLEKYPRIAARFS